MFIQNGQGARDQKEPVSKQGNEHMTRAIQGHDHTLI